MDLVLLSLALAPRPKHSITVPTVSYAIDMLRLLEKQKQEMGTATELNKIQAKDKNAAQSTKILKGTNPQNTYTKIKITLRRGTNTEKTDKTLQEHPKQKRRREKRLRDARKKRNRHRKIRKYMERKGKNKNKNT